MKLPLRLMTIAVSAVLLVATLAAYATASSVRDDLEEQLLAERAKEIALILGQAGSQVQTLLGSLTTVVRATGAEGEAFVSAAAPYTQAGFDEVLVLVPTEDGVVVANTTGGTEIGAEVDERAATLASAAVDPTSFSSATYERDGQRILGLALLAGTPDGAVVYTETGLDATADSAEDNNDQAFSEVKVAMYVDDSLSEDGFLFSTDEDERVFDDQIVEPIPFGDSEWAVAVAADGNLAGDLTNALPLILLIAGLVLTAAIALVVEATQRRREYAERMVKAREAELDVAHQQLVEAEKAAAVGEMAATMAHELRNPLGVLSNVHFLLRARAAEVDENVARQLDQADREVGAATSIVSDILAFTKPRDLIRESNRVDEVVDEALRASPPPSHVTVEVDGLEGAVVDVDRDLFRQAIIALVDNAVDAIADRSDGGGTLTLRGASTPDHFELTISDDGVGMVPEVLERAFEPFFSTRINGVGLGLTVASQIAAAHGGRVDVISGPSGTIATATWPLAGVDSMAGATQSEGGVR